MYFEKKLYKLLTEDEFKAISKDTGKVVVFKSKDAMKAALKKGSHTKADKPKGDKKRSDADLFKKQNMDKDPDDIDDLSPDAVLGKDRDEAKVQDAIEGVEEGVLDALSRGLDYGDPDVADMVYNDMEYAKEQGATVKDFEELANKLQDPQASEIIKNTLEQVYDDAGSLADPNMDEPGDGEDEEGKEANAEESDEAISFAIKNAIPQSMKMFDQTKDEIFDEIINTIGDEDEYADIVDNIDSKDPDDYPSSATFNIAHHIIRAGISRGELDREYDQMQVASYLENMEEDLYDQIMNPDQYDERIKVKESFQKRAGIIRG